MKVSESRLRQLIEKASAEEPTFGDIPDVDEVLSMCEEILKLREAVDTIFYLLEPRPVTEEVLQKIHDGMKDYWLA